VYTLVSGQTTHALQITNKLSRNVEMLVHILLNCTKLVRKDYRNLSNMPGI